MDPVEGVRAAACRAVCTACTASGSGTTNTSASASSSSLLVSEGVAGVCARLRDKKPAVRAAAAEGLILVFRAWCTAGAGAAGIYLG